MSVFGLYIINEKKLPSDLSGVADQEKYDRLVHAVELNGAKWAELSIPVLDFAKSLETIDAQMGGFKFLPVFAFNNSPHGLLGTNGDCPCFGYFSPSQISDLFQAFKEIPPKMVEQFQRDEGYLGQVYDAFQLSTDEAHSRGYAVSVIHS